MKRLSLTLIVILSTTSAFNMNGDTPSQDPITPSHNSLSQETRNLVMQHSETRRRLDNLTATQEAQDQRARAQERYHNLQVRLHAAGIAYTGQ
jgi:hypothetical protein